MPWHPVDARPARTARHWILAATLVTVLLLAACSAGDNAEQAAGQVFLSALGAGDVTAAAAATDDPAAATPVLKAGVAALKPTSAQLTAGAVTSNGDTSMLAFAAAWTLPGLATPWTYGGQLAMVQDTDGNWRVHWQPQDVHPKLGVGDTLVLDRRLPERAPILDASGRPLLSQVDTVTVGIEPKLVPDPGRLAATLAGALHITAADITASISAAGPNDFVPVITLRKSDYAAVAGQIHDLPGTVFHTGTQLAGPSPHYAQPLIGQIAAPTAEALKTAGPGYLAADQIGVSGLQQVFNTQLAGTASATISVRTAQGALTPIGQITGAPGTALATTIDSGVQQAAEKALAGVAPAAAIVAIRASTGEILAVANSTAAPFDIALAGRYPPGSTFKIVTAAAVLASGVAQPDTTVACPGSLTIDGRTIPNENNFDLGTVTLTQAFANSCNTSFSLLSQKLPDRALDQAAAAFGVGAGWQLPVDSFSGAYTPGADAVGKAANAFGQGSDLVSPLSEALIAATAARGSVPAPSLLVGRPATATNPPPAPQSAFLPALATLMRAVVTDGTARNLAGIPGGPVLGKTGTAEHGNPPTAHSWFTGYQGDVAFAVFVQDGQTGGVPSNPIAARFLTALPR